MWSWPLSHVGGDTLDGKHENSKQERWEHREQQLGFFFFKEKREEKHVFFFYLWKDAFWKHIKYWE